MPEKLYLLGSFGRIEIKDVMTVCIIYFFWSTNLSKTHVCTCHTINLKNMKFTIISDCDILIYSNTILANAHIIFHADSDSGADFYYKFYIEKLLYNSFFF